MASSRFRAFTKDVVPGMASADRVLSRLGIKSQPPRSGSAFTEGYRLIRSLSTTLSPKESKELLLHHRFANNRNVNDIQVDNLVRDMQTILNLSLAYVYTGKQWTLRIVNGHQSLFAQTLRRSPITVNIVLYECKTESGFASLYGIYDDNCQRTASQVANAVSLSTKFSAPVSYVTRCAAAIRCAQAGWPGAVKRAGNAALQRIIRDDKTQAFAAFIHGISRSAAGASTQHNQLMPMNILGCFYAMWLAESEHAGEFIKEYLSGENLSSDSPIYVLRNKILREMGKAGYHAANMRIEHLSWMSQAWKGWMDGRRGIRFQSSKKVSIPEYQNWGEY